MGSGWSGCSDPLFGLWVTLGIQSMASLRIKKGFKKCTLMNIVVKDEVDGKFESKISKTFPLTGSGSAFQLTNRFYHLSKRYAQRTESGLCAWGVKLDKSD